MSSLRTPLAAEGPLSPQEREALHAHQQLWERRHLRTEPMAADAAGRAVGALYRAAGLHRPRIVLVSSPGALAIATDDSNLWPAIDSTGNVAEQVLAATHAPADLATANALDATCLRAMQNVEADLHDLRDALDDAMRDAFNNGTLTPLMERLAREVLGLRLPEHAASAAWEQSAIDTGVRYLHPQFCMVSDFPESLADKEEAGHTLGTGRRRYRWRDGWAV